MKCEMDYKFSEENEDGYFKLSTKDDRLIEMIVKAADICWAALEFSKGADDEHDK